LGSKQLLFTFRRQLLAVITIPTGGSGSKKPFDWLGWLISSHRIFPA